MQPFIIKFIIISITLFTPLLAEVDLNYNYDYEMGGVKTKFSEWVPYKMHKWSPKFLEDYYEMYGLKLHYGENELRKDIYFLKIGLESRFRHPNIALCQVKNEREYHKYRLLLSMHLNLQIMRAYMRIASQYDKRHVYFQNLDYAYDLKKSFKIAEGFYKEAIPYWKKAETHAKKANEIHDEVNLGTMESERYDIAKGKLNFGNIIGDHLSRLSKKMDTVEEYLKENPEADKPPL